MVRGSLEGHSARAAVHIEQGRIRSGNRVNREFPRRVRIARGSDRVGRRYTLIHAGRILVVGGRCNQTPRNVVGDIVAYDPKAKAWSVVGALPEKVLAPAAAIIDGRIVVTGGGLNNPRPLTAATWIAPLP